MMNNSSGFQGNSLLGSSTGFKKRNLLRPPSGMLNKRLEFLRSVDISQSEPAIATLLRGEVASIEQQINLLDKDRKIRQSEGGLQKGYATAFRKWLREGQTLNEKEDEDSKILKQLGVDNYEGGFKKLWRIACQLDLMVTKISELQIVHFLLYDEMFDEIGKDTQKSNGLLSSIANNGYVAGTFQITQVLLDRSKDAFAATKKGSSSGKGREDSKQRQQTNELIAQLKSENEKLRNHIEMWSVQREMALKKQQAQRRNDLEQRKPKEQAGSTAQQPRQAFKQIEEKYLEQLRYLTSEKARAEEAVIEMKVKIASLQAQVKADAELFKLAPLGPKPKSGSYEQALMQEMQKMKRGFQRKISVLTEQFTVREKELRKKQAQYKSENQKIRWQKSLLLKKFELIPQK